jgi:hypothetical protein
MAEEPHDLVPNEGTRNSVTSYARTGEAAPPLFGSRRGLSSNANEGAIEIESARAIAEAQAAFVVAMRNPRDETKAFFRMTESCKRIKFAAQAFYNYNRGGQAVEGLSIRAAEELARHWGNLEYGIVELSQGDGFSELMAYCIDLESNVRSQQKFTVKHVRDTRGGPKNLTDQRDIYETNANMGARRLRARILAILPADYVDEAEESLKRTLSKGETDKPLADRIKKMLSIFMEVNVTPDMLEARLGHPLDKTNPAELVILHGVWKALKDDMTTIDQEFPQSDGAPAAAITGGSGRRGASTADAIKKGEAKKVDSPVVETKAKAETKAEPDPEKATPAASTEASKAPAAPKEPEPKQEPPQASLGLTTENEEDGDAF